jgi:hypothetical protein
MTEKDTPSKEIEETHDGDADSGPRRLPIVWLASLAAVWFLGLSTWLNMVEIPDLRDDLGYQRDTIFSLTEEIDRLQQYITHDEQKISRLEAQITPFRVVALQKYGPDEAKALKLLCEDVIPIVRNLSRSVPASKVGPFEPQQ